jgi:hypothetical protein
VTPEELAAIKARAEAATPGPWGTNEFLYAPGEWSMAIAPVNGHGGWIGGGVAVAFPHEDGHQAQDATFIAASREDVPALVAEVERLRQALEDYGRHSEGCSGQYGSSYRCRCGWRDEARALGIGVHEEGAA